MFPLAHAGFAAALAHLASRKVALRADAWAWAALGGVLPDLLDKPLALGLGLTEGRLVGHTVLFAALLLAVGAWARDRPLGTTLALLGGGCLSHLLLDRPLAGTVLWPLLGPFPMREPRPLEAFALDPLVLLGEAGGALVLGLLAARRWRRGADGAG